MDDTTGVFEQLGAERHRRRQKAKRDRLYCATPEGFEVTAEVFLGPLIKYLAGKDPDNPNPPIPPDVLNARLGQIPNPYPWVALVILEPLLDTLARGWGDHDATWRQEGFKQDPWEMLLVKKMGERMRDWLLLREMESISEYDELLKKGKATNPPPAAWLRRQGLQAATGDKLIPRVRLGRKPVYQFLHDEWGPAQCVVAGDWMYRVARALPCFGTDEDGRLCIAPEWQARVNKICDDVERRSIVNKPHRSPPPPWTGWWSNYRDRPRQPFVRDWHEGASAAHEAAFAMAKPPAGAAEQNRLWEKTGEEPSGPFAALADARLWLPFDHAAGVNAIKSVPLRINQALLPLVDKFAVELMDHEGKKRKYDRQTVTTDLRHAGGWGADVNYLDYNCDHRGRLNPIQPLNYAREDHDRALFEFARGAPLTADGVGGKEAMHWLEIHAVNCWGRDQIDKKPWADRIRWTKEHDDLIKRVATDPHGSFEEGWRNADKPFAFVAACQELSRVHKNGTDFETHLPIGFDGTANGAQHLVLLSFDRRSHNLATERDWEAARLVNLIDNKEPHDLYLAVTRRIMELLWAGDGRLCTKGKSERDARCFEFWRRRLSELEEEQLRKLFKSPLMTFLYSARPLSMQEKLVEVYADLFEKNEPRDDAAAFLTKAVRQACADTLPGPMRIMKYISALALHCFKQKRFMEWSSPSGFFCSNKYEKPNIVEIDLLYGGVRSRYTVADGTLPEMMKGRILDAAPPNFVHSLDAAHLVRTVLAANRDGIRDILPVHDCYSCLAPFARRFGQLIRREMASLYITGDPLVALRSANVDDPKTLPLPQRANIDPLIAQDTEYSFT